MVSVALHHDQLAMIAIVAGLLARQVVCTTTVPRRASAALISGFDAFGLVASALVLACDARSGDVSQIASGCGIAFSLCAREYATLVERHIHAAAHWPPRPHRRSGLVVHAGLLSYLLLGRPQPVLAMLAVGCLLWAACISVAAAWTIARRERDRVIPESRQRLHGARRWRRLGDGVSAANDPAFWGQIVARPLARLTLQALAEQPWLTPNRITAVSVACCFGAAIAMLVPDSTALTILTLALLGIRSVLDSLDGQLARYRACGSHFGSYVDKVTDVFCWGALYGALGLRAHAADPTTTMALLPMFSGVWLVLSGTALWLARAVSADPHRSGATGSRTTLGFAAWARNLWRVVLFEEPDFYLWIGLALATSRYDVFVPLIACGHVARGLLLAISRAGSVFSTGNQSPQETST